MRSFLKNNRKNLVDGGDKGDGLGVKQAVHREERKAEEETNCVGGRMESSPGTHCVWEGWRVAQGTHRVGGRTESGSRHPVSISVCFVPGWSAANSLFIGLG